MPLALHVRGGCAPKTATCEEGHSILEGEHFLSKCHKSVRPDLAMVRTQGRSEVSTPTLTTERRNQKMRPP